MSSANAGIVNVIIYALVYHLEITEWIQIPRFRSYRHSHICTAYLTTVVGDLYSIRRIYCEVKMWTSTVSCVS
jgi:hypothetical protein